MAAGGRCTGHVSIGVCGAPGRGDIIQGCKLSEKRKGLGQAQGKPVFVG